MAGSDQKWFDIATDFPAGLDTDTDPTKLKDGQTPDAYNMDINKPGVLASLPTGMSAGTAYIARTYTIGADTYTWFYNRLWRMSTTMLYYLAPLYQDAVIYQDIGRLAFDEDTQNLVTFFPFAGDGVFVAKSTGGYMIPNAGPRGNFTHGNIEQSLFVATANNAAPLSEIAHVSNTNGLFAWNGQQVAELTRNVRTIVGAALSPNYFASRRIQLDYQKRRVILSSASDSNVAVYDPTASAGGRIFVYTTPTSDFRFTTRTLTDARTRPFTIHKIALYFENTTGADAEIEFQIKLDTDEWQDNDSFEIRDTDKGRVRREKMLDKPIQARRFALRLTSLPSNIEISRISVLGENITSEEGWSQ